MTTTITTAGQADVLSGTMNQAGDTFTVPALGTIQAVGIQIAGTFVAGLVFEATVDGVTWAALQGVTPGGSVATSASSPTALILPAGGFQAVRVRVSTYTSGTVNVAATINGGWLPMAGSSAVTATISGTPTMNIATTGETAFTLTSAATTNATLVKNGASSIHNLMLTNYSAAIKYFKLYNKGTAPVVGTDVPVATIPIPANSHVSFSYAYSGLRLTVGIAYAITGAMPDSDTTAVAAGDVKVYGHYF